MQRWLGCASLSLIFAWASISSAQDPASLKGHWHADLQRSLNPHSSNTARVTLDILTDDGKVFESTETIVRTDGSATVISVRAPIDGSFHPVHGSDSDFSVAIADWRPGTARIEFRSPTGLYGAQVCKLSAINTIVCDLITTDLQGH